MLAQNFKTPADLGITDAEFEALVKVLGMLERAEVEHVAGQQFTCGKGYRHRTLRGFNMLSFYAKAECGTVGCICGWAEFIGKLKPFSLARKRFGNAGLAQLFEPGSPVMTADVAPGVAAIALRNYLTHGEPRWAEALND